MEETTGIYSQEDYFEIAVFEHYKMTLQGLYIAKKESFFVI